MQTAAIFEIGLEQARIECGVGCREVAVDIGAFKKEALGAGPAIRGDELRDQLGVVRLNQIGQTGQLSSQSRSSSWIFARIVNLDALAAADPTTKFPS